MGGGGGGRILKWAAAPEHLGGIPRRLAVAAAGTFAKAVTSLANNTAVHNPDTLINLVRSRPQGTPLLTVSNHMSTLDDPLLWGFKGFPVMDPNLARWVLAAEDICFKSAMLSYIFRIGKCIPITRGAGIYQEHMNEAVNVLGRGEWLIASFVGAVAYISRRKSVPGEFADQTSKMGNRESYFTFACNANSFAYYT